MPTPDDIAAYQRRRAKFMSAVWDAEEREEIGFGIKVDQMLQEIGETALPVASIRRLVEDLIGDGMVKEFNPFHEQAYPNSVKLTSYGRAEVQRWVTDEKRGTDAFPLSYQQVYNNYNTTVHGNVSGSNFVAGSTGTHINQSTQIIEQKLSLAMKAAELLEASGITGDEREEVVADIETLREDDPTPTRLKAALRRLSSWRGSAAGDTTAPQSGEIQSLARQLLDPA